LELAAESLGASPWRVFFTITLPLAMPGIVTGLILAFSRSLGEFGATITFVGNIEGETRTLPLAIYTYTQMPGGDMIAMRLVVISILIALSALIVSNLLERRMAKKMGRI
jgi:molybdate transport system permease protein